MIQALMTGLPWKAGGHLAWLEAHLMPQVRNLTPAGSRYSPPAPLAREMFTIPSIMVVPFPSARGDFFTRPASHGHFRLFLAAWGTKPESPLSESVIGALP